MKLRGSGLFGWALDLIPTLLVLVALGAVAYWGYRTEWGGITAPEGKEEEGGEKEHQSSSSVEPGKESECPLAGARVTLESAEVAGQVGLRFEAVRRQALAARIRAPGELTYDQALVQRLSARAGGTAWRVDKQVGDRVSKGEVLALVDASEVGKAKADLLSALAQVELKQRTLERMEPAYERGSVPEATIREARAAVREARIRRFNALQALVNLGLPVRLKDVEKLPEEKLTRQIQLLGLPRSVTGGLDPETTTANLLPVTASLDGVVVERQVVTGEVVEPGKTLFVVADVRRLWLLMDVALEDADRLALGQPVDFRPDGHPGEAIRGKLSWISTDINEKTRTQRARADVDNPKGHFRARTFGTALVTVRDAPRALVVPSEAIQREGRCHAVFVRLSDTTFQGREVKLGAREGKVTEVLEGLQDGDVVVTTGSHALKAEVLKGQLADHD